MYTVGWEMLRDGDRSAWPSHLDALSLARESETHTHHQFVVRVIAGLAQDRA